MKKYFIGLLVTTTILSSTAFTVKAGTIPTENCKNTIATTQNNLEETFTISNTKVDENGMANLKVNFKSEEYNSVLVIYDRGQEIYRTKLMPPSKEFNIKVQLTDYRTHYLTAKLGLTQGDVFDAYAKSNEIAVGYYNPKIREQIALSYIDQNTDTYDFNVILPSPNYNCFVAVYDNGNLIYRTKLIKTTDKVTFSSSLLGPGRHDLKAYVGLTQGMYFDPYMTSNTITIFK